MNKNYLVGSSGIVSSKGNIQFTLDQAKDYHNGGITIENISKVPAPTPSKITHDSQFLITNPPSFISNNHQINDQQSSSSAVNQNMLPHLNQNQELEFKNNNDITRISLDIPLTHQSSQFVPPTFQSAPFVPPTFQITDLVRPTLQNAPFVPPTFQNAPFVPPTFQIAQLVPPTFQNVPFVPPTFQNVQLVPHTLQSTPFVPPTIHDISERQEKDDHIHTSLSQNQIKFMQGDKIIILEGFTTDQVE
ncbi:unnamed protein product, partial [Meganyctiphanes norvegica]